MSGESVPVSSEEELAGGKTYYWQAHYGGDSKNAESTSACTEIANVKAKTSLSTALSGEGKEGTEIEVLEGTKITDKATLTGTNSSSAGGKVTYKVYSEKECKTPVTEAGEKTVTAGSVPASNEEEPKVGTYYWQASYSGDSLHQESTSGCTEILAVKTTTSLTTSLSGEGAEEEEIAVLSGAGAIDHATLSGANAATAGGTVTYKVYSDDKCTELVTEAGKVTVTSGSVPASTEEKLAAGTYYWQASYSGDSLNKSSTSTCGDEVLVVNTETSLTTSLASEGGSGATVEVTEGVAVSDEASLSGMNASEATGTVEYNVYSDSECTKFVINAGTVTEYAGFTPPSPAVDLEPGTYYWQATYSGDSLNHTAKSTCGSEKEVVVAPALTTSLSGGGEEGGEIEVHPEVSVGDKATLHVENVSTATGTVKYYVYSDESCEELYTAAGEVTVTAGSIPESSKETLPLGTYFWQAVYSGDGSHPGATSACGTEVQNVRSSTSLSTSLSAESKSGPELEVQEGSDITDTATLGGSSASEAGGTVEYEVYSDNKCTELAAEAGSVTVTSGSVPSSNAVALPAGTYYWQATYSGDAKNQYSLSICGSETSIVNETLTTSLSGGGHSGEEIELAEEAGAHDTATLHGPHASTATGTVKYYVYSDRECTDLVTAAGEVTVTMGSIPSSTEETLATGHAYYWQAVYSGDGAHPEAKSICGKEIEKVDVPWTVSVGDSFISGEGGRWAGNTQSLSESDRIDALGTTAYYGEPNRELGGSAIPYCHRSKSAEIFTGEVQSKNLACSGAETTSAVSSVWAGLLLAPVFKPGLDFLNVPMNRVIRGGPCPLARCEGQARLLETFARARKLANEDIKMVALSIGGNDFGFAGVIQACATAYVLNRECNTQAAIKARFEEPQVKLRREGIERGIRNIGQAMANAGFAKGEYTIVVQDYESPIPELGAQFRYPANASRRTVGGCPFGNADAKWANATALTTIDETVKKAAESVNAEAQFKVEFLELKEAFNGRRLCETGVKLVGEGRPRRAPLTWRSPNAVDKSEWINQLRVVTLGTPFYQQESIHPNFWGQLALRNCLRKAYNGGAPKGGTCKIEGPGLTAVAGGLPPVVAREPLMELK